MEKELTFMKEDLEKLVEGGWGASNRAKNYIKRGTGIGGGSHGKTIWVLPIDQTVNLINSNYNNYAST